MICYCTRGPVKVSAPAIGTPLPGVLFGMLLFLLMLGCGPSLVPREDVQMVRAPGASETGGGARVENLSARQEGRDAVLTYDLIGAGAADEVVVEISLDDGKSWKPPKGLWGHLGEGVAVGKGKHIQWATLEEFPKGFSGEVRFKVITATERDRQDCVARDGRFCKLGNGMVLDTERNLMWAPEDNGRNINWSDAKRYCENYRGGGYTDWRMPTQDELAGLYDKSKGYRATQRDYTVHLTELIRLSTAWIWASETRGSEAATFSFDVGHRDWVGQSRSYAGRALPVRASN